MGRNSSIRSRKSASIVSSFCGDFMEKFPRGFKKFVISWSRKFSSIKRKIIFSGPVDFTHLDHKYFMSYLHEEVNKSLAWIDAKNICRQYCMDLVAVEYEEENNKMVRLIEEHLMPYVWTGGHVCDFPDCEDKLEILPHNIYGWFWTSNRRNIPATNKAPYTWTYNPWSPTGSENLPQPDDAEWEINYEDHESCLSILHNVYNDGIKWNDVACYHEMPFVCEDSDELLKILE